jgi:rhodanese-related sulfurtransferase
MMKKLLLLVSVLTFALVLTACAKEEEVKEIPAEVTMETVDEYLNRDDVQYVDLRNFEDKMASGYIAGFEMLPFFNYFEYEGILVRTDKDWEFASEDVVDQAKLENFFDKDKTIFLMCGSGTRAGFVKSALEEIGYTNVINVGGIRDYAGDNKVLGYEGYNLDVTPKGAYTPGTYYGYEAGYNAIIVIGPAGAVQSVYLDAMHCKDLLNSAGEAYATDEATDGIKESCFMKQSYTAAEYPMNYDFATGAAKLNDDGTSKLLWAEQADALAAAVLAAQGWSADWAIDLSTDGGHDYFTDGQDAVAGVTLGIENWKVAVEEALTAAMGN